MSQNCHDHRCDVVLRLRGFLMVRVVRLIQMNLTIALHRPANVRPTELKLWAHAARDSIKPRDLRGVDKFNTFTSVSWANLTLHLVGLNKRNCVSVLATAPCKGRANTHALIQHRNGFNDAAMTSERYCVVAEHFCVCHVMFAMLM